MNCSYCHVNQSSDCMSTNTIDRIIKSATTIVDRYKPEKFYFIIGGGDPLLNLPIVFELSRKSNVISNVYKSLWTNGLSLNDENMKKITDEKIDVVLSANESSIEFILKKINLIKKYQPKTRVSITVNELNRQRLPELTESLLQEKHLIRYYLHYTAFEDPTFIDNYIKTMKQCINIISKYINNPKELNHMFEFLDLTNKSKKSPYLVGRSIFVFDPNGDVRTTLPLRDSKDIIGNVINDNKDYIDVCKNYPDRRKCLPRWSAKDIKECNNCEVRNVCQGGYPIPKYYAYGRFDVPSPYCKSYKELIPQYIELYNKVKNEFDRNNK